MRRYLFLVILFYFPVLIASAKDYRITSPDGRLSLTVTSGKQLSWSASYDGNVVMTSPRIAMMTSDGLTAGENDVVRKSTTGNFDGIVRPVVPNKRAEIKDNYTYLLITFKSGFAVRFRAYNDGIAYRFESQIKDSITIKEEVNELVFPAGTHSWFPYERSFMSHNENVFVYSSLDTITSKHLASLPVLFRNGDVNVLLTEASIEDYAGMWLRGAGNGKLTAVWPHYPKKERLSGDRNMRVTETMDYIARVKGTRAFPWRAYVITPDDGALVSSDMVSKLAEPNRLTDVSWIKPGKVAWDWWNANNIYGVNFRAGLNNQTYKYYIDFASSNNLEYVILDEGWYSNADVLSQAPGFDIPELCRYAASKNVGVILWVVWKSLDDKLEEALSTYEKWGVKGVKVDFMQRDDQKMVRFYYRATEMAAKYHMLIDFHGAYKPDGFNITYPNAITREGVKGLENSKWSKDINPEHDLTIPFTRMVAGAMDYTPGSMINMEKENFSPIFNRPTSQGTRVHQLAMYVIFESPLQMLADNPSNYMKEQECTSFISKIPVTWDETKVLQARVSDYLALARKKGNDWFIGAMTDWTPRDIEIDFSFLGEGTYNLELFEDGINADRYAGDYSHRMLEVNKSLRLKVHVAPGGGWVAKVSPKL
ncbi:MAG: glycoside hydrolase family 97 protein [Bacteroidales bacterium]